ncbi:MAG: FprA family A-type flavoprotein [Myxococcales bacterium]|nr:MAG: FprA family A-type flavoprotein [Myxococcales bacterium]
MKAIKIREGLHWVGAVDWDRRLFDALMPLPDGTSYNAYLLQGREKTVLLDAVEPAFAEALLDRLADLGVRRIDYVVSHHAEQDHSGTLPLVLEQFPEAVALCTKRGKGMLQDLLPLPAERLRVVASGETIDLGGRTLEFIEYPWVHWPETMMTYLREEGILFSCDFFGSHLAANRLFFPDRARQLDAARLYWAQIMMPFRRVIGRQFEKLVARPLSLICPSHGPLWDEPAAIVEPYRDWIFAKPKNHAVVAYVSMHDSTRRMVDHLIDALTAEGVGVSRFELSGADVGRLASALVDAATIVIGSPTVLGGLHPAAAYACLLANVLKPKARLAAFVGSHGWAGKAKDDFLRLTPKLQVDVVGAVAAKGAPRAETFAQLDALAKTIAERYATLGEETGGEDGEP